MRKILINILCLTGVTAVCHAQGNSTYWGLTQFLNSEFIQKFDEARNKAEQSVIDFQRIRHEFSDEDIAIVMDAYNASAEKFNQILYKVQEDLLDRQKRKFIIKFPDDYAREIEGELNRAKEFYGNNYQREVVRVTQGRITGTPLLVLLPEIIKYGRLAFELFQTIKKEVKKYNMAMLEEHLIQPYRFRSWNELAN
jgi:phosphoenolpyruvate carboxylase